MADTWNTVVRKDHRITIPKKYDYKPGEAIKVTIQRLKLKNHE